MKELYAHPSCGGNSLVDISDDDLAELIKDIIDCVMIENGVYYDNDDREKAVKTIYPVIANIVFCPDFSHVKHDRELLLDVITYLIIRLA